MVLPATIGLEAIARAQGYDPIALITPRLRDDADEGSRERHALIEGAPPAWTFASPTRRTGSNG